MRTWTAWVLCSVVVIAGVRAGARDLRAKGQLSAALRIAFVDVGQGDAILIQLGDFYMLVDTGPPDHWDSLARRLATVSGPIELVVITHPHDDHYGQLAAILEHFEVRRLVTKRREAAPPQRPARL